MKIARKASELLERNPKLRLIDCIWSHWLLDFEREKINIEFCMSLLNTDTILHIGSFLDLQDALALTQVNRDIRANSDQLLRIQFQKAFGKINNNQDTDKRIIARLLCFAGKQPDSKISYNVYKVPSYVLDRSKWMAGVENNLDVEVQEDYDCSINLLNNTEPTSIFQLKNKLIGFWHIDRQIKDYIKYKSEEIERTASSLFRRSFFACTGLFYKYYYNPSILNIGKKLQSRSEETFAKIGSFYLNDKNYDVVASHILADEKYAGPFGFVSKFHSVSGTNISFIEREQFYLFRHRSNHNFSICIGRKKVNGGCPSLSIEENKLDHKVSVLNRKRHLCVQRLSYLDFTENIRGSDRLLDQKLTQIMIEISLQNQGIRSLKVVSHYDCLTVLTAAGFKSCDSQKIMEELNEFRSKAENKLFPPFKDRGTRNLVFKSEDFTKPIVYFSTGAPESWEEIIQREPILNNKFGVLPEYWAVKPNIVDENFFQIIDDF